MKEAGQDPFGLKSLILSRGLTLASFARACGASPQAVNNWIERGVPSKKVFDAADALDMPADQLRAYTSEGRRPHTDAEAEIRRFVALFTKMDSDLQDSVLSRLNSRRR